MHFATRSPQQRACGQRTLPTSGVRVNGRFGGRCRAALAALLMLSLSACDTPLEPADIAGTYVFAPAAGLRFQIPVDGTPQEFTLRIADTLTLRSDGSALISGVSEWMTSPPDAPAVGPRSIAFTFRIDDRMLEASAPTNVCLNVYEPCVWTFRISGDQLIRENGATPEYREVYTRVGPPLR